MNLEELFIKLGYTKEEYEIIVNYYTFKNSKIETISNKILENYNFFLSIGYSKEDVIKMTKSSPQIYGYKLENIKQKIEDIMSLGYSKEDVIKMTKSFPSIYGLSIENMKQRIEDMILLGYSKEDVIKMTKVLPSIYGLSIENIKKKIDFYDSIDMHELAIIDSKQLMQSVDLTYARYMFYESIGIKIDINNYRKLFIGNANFEKQYSITKKELLEKYNYKKYMEEKNDRTI